MAVKGAEGGAGTSSDVWYEGDADDGFIALAQAHKQLFRNLLPGMSLTDCLVFHRVELGWLGHLGRYSEKMSDASAEKVTAAIAAAAEFDTTAA